MTAAHCCGDIVGKHVVAGIHNVHTETGKRKEILEAHIHPGYPVKGLEI
jgi:hypothetical protein